MYLFVSTEAGKAYSGGDKSLSGDGEGGEGRGEDKDKDKEKDKEKGARSPWYRGGIGSWNTMQRLQQSVENGRDLLAAAISSSSPPLSALGASNGAKAKEEEEKSWRRNSSIGIDFWNRFHYFDSEGTYRIEGKTPMQLFDELPCEAIQPAALFRSVPATFPRDFSVSDVYHSRLSIPL